MTSQIEIIGQTLLDLNGDPIVGGKMHTYATGTSTPQATYSDAALTTTRTNPLLTDAEGRWPVPIYVAALQYKLVITDASDVVLQTIDPYSPASFLIAQLGANLRPFSIDNQGLLTDSQEIYEILIPAGATYTLPAGAVNSRADADAAATSINTITVFKNTSSVGTIAFAAGGAAGVWTVASDVVFAAGDRLRFVNQATADASLADVRITVVLTAG